MSHLVIISSAFAEGGPIPGAQACQARGGANRSPQLSWSGAPAGTAGYAVTMDDEDPPCGQGDRACRHWSVFNLPAGKSSLEEGEEVSRSGAVEGENYLGGRGYAGPCPPRRHRYRITLFALAAGTPEIAAGTPLTRSQFRSRYGEYILAEATLSGWFG